jgi:hypothetical protein
LRNLRTKNKKSCRQTIGLKNFRLVASAPELCLHHYLSYSTPPPSPTYKLGAGTGPPQAKQLPAQTQAATKVSNAPSRGRSPSLWPPADITSKQSPCLCSLAVSRNRRQAAAASLDLAS